MSVKREDLIKVAKELNDVLGLDPQIKTGKKVTDKELTEQILEAADLILPEDDISDETMQVIKILKGEIVEEQDEEEVNDEFEVEEGEDELEEEDEEEVEEEEVEDEEEEEEEEEEDEEGDEEEKPAPKLAKKAEKPAEKSKVKAKPTPPSTGVGVTRIGAAALVIKRAKNVLTIEDWVKRTDELYVKEGGKPNLKESRYAVNVAVKVLETYGLIEVTGDKVSKLE